MIIDLVDKLVDRFIQLIEKHKEVERNLFQEYLEPIISDFEKVHDEYLNTFRRYRAAIKESQIPLTVEHPIFDSIHEDIVFTAGLRSKVWELTRAEGDPVFGEFIESVSRYLRDREEVDSPIDSNAYRDGLIEWLKYEFEQETSELSKKQEAIRHIDRTVEKMQARYADVISQYGALKKKLLNH